MLGGAGVCVGAVVSGADAEATGVGVGVGVGDVWSGSEMIRPW